ncbi:hypothetical protein C0J09_11550 [Bordetella avium]|uniref:hypothetical protein n=1 Tax=Bordetella avium TaxID=521 RepID=UPI000FD8D116|nr:hypothetical protein [Bordetella avium]AZY49706.1 hypothetical protein C0J09_11550 [Bordetella avium]
MSMTAHDQKAIAVDQWNTLADAAERHAALGLLHPSVAAAQADCYRRAARSIQREIDTGVAVCSCCFKPFGRGSLALQ